MAPPVISFLHVVTLLLMEGLQTCSTTSNFIEEFTEDYCPTETFQPRCQKNELILMKSATYGRMRVGRCIPAVEVDTLGTRYIGCSADVLALMDRKCTGKTECNVLIIQISAENIKPCFSGLSVYLETSYSCLNMADEKRSCVVAVSTTPIHIIGSRTCGVKSQPWIAEAPVGQKISISLIVFPASNYSTQTSGKVQQPCHSHGVIVDKAGKRNVTICADGNQRQKKIYLSAGNIVDIFLNSPDEGSTGDDQHVIIGFQAVGCSDIIPPEDAYVQRNGDDVVVCCYTIRKSWHLRCSDRKWIGVIGNCSMDNSELELDTFSEIKASSINDQQVLVILAVVGFTFAICLAVICFGAVYLRRSYFKKKSKQEYKTINYHLSSNGSEPSDQAIRNLTGNDMQGISSQQMMPTYSVFLGDGEFNNVNSVSANNTNPCA